MNPFNKFFQDADKKQAISWAFYDFANSSYSLLIMSFIFPIFFREVIAGGNKGDFLWGLAVSLSIVLGGLASPIIGAMADYDQRKKRKFIFFASLAMLGTALFYFTGPNTLFLGFSLFVLTNFCFEIGQTLYDSFLLRVSTEKNSGRISGLGWGLGYLGGIAAMLLLKPFYAAGYANEGLYKLTFPLTALFFLLFALPAFLFIKEQKGLNHPKNLLNAISIGFKNTYTTLKQIKQYKNIAWFLVGFYLLNDALVTIFAFVPIFAKVSLGMSFAEITTALLVVQLIGFPAAIFFGWLSDKKGSKKILLTTIVIWGMIVLGISFATTKPFFYFMAILTGLVIGSSQAIARSWFSKIIPRDKMSQFFGFNGFSSKIAATTGPLVFGLISLFTGNQRIAMACLLIYFIIAFFIFLRIKDEREKNSI